MPQRSMDPPADLPNLAELSPLLLDRVPNPVLRKALTRMLDPARPVGDREAAFDNNVVRVGRQKVR